MEDKCKLCGGSFIETGGFPLDEKIDFCQKCYFDKYVKNPDWNEKQLDITTTGGEVV